MAPYFRSARSRQSYARSRVVGRMRGMSGRRDTLGYVMRSSGRMAKKRTSYGKSITTQHDYQNQYRKKRMPRRKRRQWDKFVKKVTAVSQRNLGTRTVVFNAQMTFGSTGTAQGWFGFCLYGFNSPLADSSITCGNQDMAQVFFNDPEITKSGPPARPISGKLTFHSGIMDVTFCNTGTNVVELDVYVVYHRKYVKSNAIGTSFVTGQTNTDRINPANAQEITVNTRGVTPFDIPAAISSEGLKIVKKTKYFINANGGIATYQVRDPKNYIVNADNFENNSGYACPGKTHSILCVLKNVTGVAGNASLNVGVTRKYCYTVESTSQTKDNLLPFTPV